MGHLRWADLQWRENVQLFKRMQTSKNVPSTFSIKHAYEAFPQLQNFCCYDAYCERVVLINLVKETHIFEPTFQKKALTAAPDQWKARF